MGQRVLEQKLRLYACVFSGDARELSGKEIPRPTRPRRTGLPVGDARQVLLYEITSSNYYETRKPIPVRGGPHEAALISASC